MPPPNTARCGCPSNRRASSGAFRVTTIILGSRPTSSSPVFDGFDLVTLDHGRISTLQGSCLCCTTCHRARRGRLICSIRHPDVQRCRWYVEAIRESACGSVASNLTSLEDAMSLATPEAFADDPSLVWQFYHYRREVVRKAQPNRAHRALALLSATPSLLGPNTQSFRLVTQNVDGLSQRALAATAPPSARPIEMHGALRHVRCTACGAVREIEDGAPCAALAGTERFFAADDAQRAPAIPRAELPRCAEAGCGGLLRPGVVWFGEGVPLLDDIEAMIARECDLFCVVGTSSEVYPAAGFADTAGENGAQIAYFNIERTDGDSEADFVFVGPCEETLPRAFGVEI
ncbi:DHS-like NAD/FAD-binding domain-containing protein [Auriscalpium vulgare]|uniref:DHS-like NAD/FAD-binding domain-containing protein n=1 Tax=Auriscalpium vulgare TaxID=40419 RepID=A0ACB8S005_9AGAM|nr:DHS-like NAD/FAD-binding domain-containing protein [Auriscalpium vulgare]